MNLLVVDDSSTMRRIIINTLKKLGNLSTRYGSDVRRVLCPFDMPGGEVFVALVLNAG